MYIVDRIIGEKVVVELPCGETQTYSKNKFTFEVKPSDVIILTEKGFILDEKQTALRKDKLKDLQKKLFDK